MKPSTLTTCLVAVLAVAGSFAASAQTATVQADVDSAAPAAQVDAQAQVQAGDAPKAEPLSESRCLRETGTLIKQRDKDGKRACIQQAPGRSYSNEDISRTGETDLADALRHLDTSIH